MSVPGASEPHRAPRAVADHGIGPAPCPGTPQELAEGVVRLTARNPGRMTGPGTNTYLIGTGEVAVVDPGPDDAAHCGAILSTAAGLGRIRWIVVTHTHPDHAPGAARLAGRTGAAVIGHAERPGFKPTWAAGDGFVLDGRDFALEAVHTPGHASDHLCWHLVGRSWLFSGDHVMHGATVVISPPDGDMSEYLESLERVGGLALERIAPGHGRLLDQPAEVVSEIVAHRTDRERRVVEVLGVRGPASVDELVAVVYADVREGLHDVARRSLWAHLRRLGALGEVECRDGRDPDGSDAEWSVR